MKIIQGDCKIVLKTLPDNLVDSIVTDPPYELGFMGKSWDNTGIANNVDMWREALRVLKPGGYLLSFGGTRTYHRMASAIEDAGFEVRDMIEWVYGSGFPKSLNIGKAVDKLQGNKREIVGEIRAGKTAMGQNSGWNDHANRTVMEATKGTSPWEGWGTALKPAHEPICMARKPLSEKTVAENVLKHGTGGINIDGSRVGTETMINHGGGINADGRKYGNGNGIPTIEKGLSIANGRFPANLIHDGSEEVVVMFPSDKARFFYCAKASKEERNRGCEGLPKKAMTELDKIGGEASNFKTGSGNDRDIYNQNNHPTVKPIALMKYLITLVTPPGGIVLDPFTGSGSTLVAAKELHFDFVGIELEEDYIKIAKKRIENI